MHVREANLQFFRDVGDADNFNTILALWARSLVWQQQHHGAANPAIDSSEALRRVRRLLLIARPSDDDIVFMCVVKTFIVLAVMRVEMVVVLLSWLQSSNASYLQQNYVYDDFS